MKKSLRVVSVLRTKETFARYQKHMRENKGNIDFFFTNLAIREWKYWRMIDNNFPYDVLTEKHHILTPKRTFNEDKDMTGDERGELFQIKNELRGDYDSVIENFTRQKTFKNHYHLHFVSYRVE